MGYPPRIAKHSRKSFIFKGVSALSRGSFLGALFLCVDPSNTASLCPTNCCCAAILKGNRGLSSRPVQALKGLYDRAPGPIFWGTIILSRALRALSLGPVGPNIIGLRPIIRPCFNINFSPHNRAAPYSCGPKLISSAKITLILVCSLCSI